MTRRRFRLLVSGAAAAAVAGTSVAALAARSEPPSSAAVGPAPRAASNPAPAPWWCAPDATLSASKLPAVLPHSACSLEGRTIVARGGGVEVPPVGSGTAAAGSDIYVWTDEYAVHVGGSAWDAAGDYLGAIEQHALHGTGAVADLRRMAGAVRESTLLSVDRVRRTAVPFAALLDAADTVVAAFGDQPATAADVLRAVQTLRPHLARAGAVDESLAVDELAARAAAVRAALSADTADAAAADGLLADAARLRSVVRTEGATAGDAATFDALVADLRAAIARGGVTVDLAPLDDERYGAALAAVETFLRAS